MGKRVFFIVFLMIVIFFFIQCYQSCFENFIDRDNSISNESHIWITSCSYGKNQSTNITILSLNLSVQRLISMSDEQLAIAYDGEAMWTADYNGNTWHKIFSNGTYFDYEGVGSNVRHITYCGGFVWGLSYPGKGVVQKVLQNGTIYGINTGVGNLIASTCDDEGNLWIVSWGGGRIVKISSNDVIESYSAPKYLHGITFDGESVWASHQLKDDRVTSSNSVIKMLWNGTYFEYKGTCYKPTYMLYNPDTNSIWTNGEEKNKISEIQLDGTIVNYTGFPDANPPNTTNSLFMTYDGEYMWSGSKAHNLIVKIANNGTMTNYSISEIVNPFAFVYGH